MSLVNAPEPLYPNAKNIYHERVVELEDAIRWVVTQQADDLCWMDVYVRLGKLVGVEITLEQLALLPKGKMLANCERFVCHLQTGVDYKPEGLAEENERLRAELLHYKSKFVESRTISKPDATIEVKVLEIPAVVQDAISKNLQGE